MDIPELFQGSNGRLGNNIVVNLVSKELLSLWSSSKKSPIHKDRSPQLTSRIPPSSYSQQTVISLCFLWLCMGASVIFSKFFYFFCFVVVITVFLQWIRDKSVPVWKWAVHFCCGWALYTCNSLSLNKISIFQSKNKKTFSR